MAQFYAERLIQTMYRSRGHAINAWRWERHDFTNRADRDRLADSWEVSPHPEQRLVVCGMKE